MKTPKLSCEQGSTLPHPLAVLQEDRKGGTRFPEKGHGRSPTQRGCPAPACSWVPSRPVINICAAHCGHVLHCPSSPPMSSALTQFSHMVSSPFSLSWSIWTFISGMFQIVLSPVALSSWNLPTCLSYKQTSHWRSVSPFRTCGLPRGPEI